MCKSKGKGQPSRLEVSRRKQLTRAQSSELEVGWWTTKPQARLYAFFWDGARLREAIVCSNSRDGLSVLAFSFAAWRSHNKQRGESQ